LVLRGFHLLLHTVDANQYTTVNLTSLYVINRVNWQHRMDRVTFLTASLLLISTWTGDLHAQADSQEATPSQGHRFALLACAPCHVVATDQEAPPILRAPGPSFDAIANKPGTTGDSLREFLSTTHVNVAASTKMPNPQLADYQMAKVIDYILSLRHKN
jgi:mono/diheme cytochrome c family protein